MNDPMYRGKYFEEFEVGDTVVTQGRTITESDIVSFAGLSGDYNPIHTDKEFAAQGQFGQRVAHGLLVQSIAVGLATMTGFIEGTIIGFRELSCKFSLPVFIGDTIQVKIQVETKKFFRRLNAGNISVQYSVINQNDEIVQRGKWVMFIKSNASSD